MMITNQRDLAYFLRQSLRANAAFSTLSGLIFIFACGAIAEFLGDLPPLLVAAVGGQLLLFAGALVWLASLSVIPAAMVIAVIVADLLWVGGTIAIVYADLFTRGGTVLAILLAAVVLLLAVVQSIGVQRMRDSYQTTALTR